MANGIFSWGIYFGYGLAYIYGKYLSEADILGQGWRAAYVIGGGPGIVIGILILLILRETRNTGAGEKAMEEDRKTAGDKVRELLRDLWTAFSQPTLILLVISASVRQIAGLAWANNNVNYFTEYFPDKVLICSYTDHEFMMVIMMTGHRLLLADRVLGVRRGVWGGVGRLDH